MLVVWTIIKLQLTAAVDRISRTQILCSWQLLISQHSKSTETLSTIVRHLLSNIKICFIASNGVSRVNMLVFETCYMLTSQHLFFIEFVFRELSFFDFLSFNMGMHHAFFWNFLSKLAHYISTHLLALSCTLTSKHSNEDKCSQQTADHVSG